MAVTPGGGAPTSGATPQSQPRTQAAPAAQASASSPASFLGSLKPASTSSQVTPMLVVGNKGCKTISAVAVDLDDTEGLPRPEGSRVVVITFDHMSAMSLENRYGSCTEISGTPVEVYSLMAPSEDGVYPGFDGSNPQSGIHVTSAFRELLKSLRDSHDVGLLVIDHYGIFIDTVGKYYAYAKAKRPLDDKLEPSQWTSRSNLFVEIDHLIRTTPMDGGFVIATGSRDVNDGQMKTVFGKNSSGKMTTAVEVVPAKWVGKIQHNWPNIIQVYKAKTEKGEIVRHAEVEESRTKLFNSGDRVNIDGRHIGALMDRSAVTSTVDGEE